MKNHLKWLILGTFWLIILPPAKGQSMLIETLDGTTHAELLSNVRNLHFAADQLIVQLNSGQTNAFALTGLRKIHFDTSTGLANQNAEKLALIPNPANNALTVSGLPAGNQTLYIYRPDGALILTKEITGNSTTLEISHLNSGLYLVRVAGFTTKFLKK